MEIYYEELAYTFVEAEKSYVLPSASWRPRRASTVISVQAQRPENQRSNGVNISSRAEEDGDPSLSIQVGRKGMNSFFFCFFSPQTNNRVGWCLPTLRKVSCFTESTNSNANPVQKLCFIWQLWHSQVDTENEPTQWLSCCGRYPGQHFITRFLLWGQRPWGWAVTRVRWTRHSKGLPKNSVIKTNNILVL